MTGTVSVIIPAWRAAATLGRAARSALEDDAVAEVIVVLDGDDEASRAALPGDSRLSVLVHAQRRGAPAARNTGLAAARGEFVLFLDADDVVEGGLLTALAQAAPEADIAFGPYAFSFLSGRRIPVDVRDTIGAPTYINVLKAWFEGLHVPSCSVLWRAAFVRAIGGWNETLLKNQDGELIWRACRAAPRIALASQGCGVYMQSSSPDRVSGDQSRAMYEQQMALLSRVESGLTPDELTVLSAALGEMYYRIARTAYYHGVTDVGRRAEAAGRRLGAALRGTVTHRLLAGVIGLRAKENLCARWHRFGPGLAHRARPRSAAQR